MLDVQDGEQIISGIEYEKEIRKYPENLRRGPFKSGWEDAVIRQRVDISKD